MSNNINIIDCKDLSEEEVFLKVKNLYLVNEVCLGEFLDFIQLTNISMSKAFRIHIALFNNIENDKIYIINEEDDIGPWTFLYENKKIEASGKGIW